MNYFLNQHSPRCWLAGQLSRGGNLSHRSQKMGLGTSLRVQPRQVSPSVAELFYGRYRSMNFQGFTKQSGGPGNFSRNFGIPAHQKNLPQCGGP